MPGSNSSSTVSIIMPTYNRAGYILETIESIRSQTHQNWEMIIIDDGSDDNTEELVCNLKDERIKFYKSTRTGLISKSRKTGVEKASGELIAFVDSDDLWAPTKLEDQVAALEQNKDAAFCLTGGYNFREEGNPVDYFYKQKEGMKYGDLFLSFFKSELAVYIQTLLFRKDCTNFSSPFYETDNDVDFILRLAKNFKGIILYKTLFFRRLHDDNYSNTNWKKNYDKGIAVIQAYKTTVAPTIVREAFFRIYINFGEDCLMNNQPGNAARNFFNAWKNKPLSIVLFKKTGKLMLQYFRK